MVTSCVDGSSLLMEVLGLSHSSLYIAAKENLLIVIIDLDYKSRAIKEKLYREIYGHILLKFLRRRILELKAYYQICFS